MSHEAAAPTLTGRTVFKAQSFQFLLIYIEKKKKNADFKHVYSESQLERDIVSLFAILHSISYFINIKTNSFSAFVSFNIKLQVKICILPKSKHICIILMLMCIK